MKLIQKKIITSQFKNIFERLNKSLPNRNEKNLKLPNVMQALTLVHNNDNNESANNNNDKLISI